MQEIIKKTKRMKCDYCDELAIIKIKKDLNEPYLYLCTNCYKVKDLTDFQPQ